MMLFGVLGYLMDEFGFELTPLVLAFVLGPIFERSLRQSLTLSKGSFSIFFNRPLSLGLLILACLVILSYFLLKKKK
jgi:putative tricarboxylic transport membrane protein